MDESPVALIGGPGAGKSTLLLKMAVQLSEKNLDNCLDLYELLKNLDLNNLTPLESLIFLQKLNSNTNK